MRTRSILLAAGLLVAPLTACGSSSDGADSAGASETAADRADDALLEFAQCMREHGIDMPDPEPGGNGIVRVGPGPGGADPQDEAFREADEACRHLLEDAMGDMEPPSPEEQAEMQDRMLEFTRCMREHGVDMPDPSFSEDGAGFVQVAPGDGSGGPPTDDPDFAEAEDACIHLLGDELVREDG